MFQLLVDLGADLRLRVPYTRYSAIHLAVLPIENATSPFSNTVNRERLETSPNPSQLRSINAEFASMLLAIKDQSLVKKKKKKGLYFTFCFYLLLLLNLHSPPPFVPFIFDLKLLTKLLPPTLPFTFL